MPDVLVLCEDPDSAIELEKLVRELECRPKSTLDFEQALQWLETRPFDFLIIGQGPYKLDSQLKLADQLWSMNPAAPLYLYDPAHNSDISAQEARLSGAELARGKGAHEILKKAIIAMRDDKTRPRNEFQILVVEDLDSPRDIICSYVEKLGFPQVSGARSAKQALAELEDHPDSFSCVITDIRMPEMTGKELIAAIRSNPKLMHLPVIALTAYGTVDMLIECLQEGASGFLVKPPKKSDLVRELSRAVRIWRGQGNPRLASHEEAELVQRLLEERRIQ